LWGCRIEYYRADRYSKQLLEVIQFYLGFDEAVKLAYKEATLNLFFANTHDSHNYPICRELFAAIGSLLPFTDEELTLKVDFTKYGRFHVRLYPCEDEDNVEDVIRATEEEAEDDRLYLDEKRMTFRFIDPILDEENMDSQYWSTTTLRIWRERVCYD
jgi:hypothetical protein